MSAGVSLFREAVAGPGNAHWVGVDLGVAVYGPPETRDALDALDHHLGGILLQAGLSADFVVAHVLAPGPGAVLPRAGISLRLLRDGVGPVDPSLVAEMLGGTPAPRLAEAGAARRSGTCLTFPGRSDLSGIMPAYRVRATVVESVVLGTTEVGDGELVELCGPVWPVFDAGRLVLRVTRTEGGRLVPLQPPAVVGRRAARF